MRTHSDIVRSVGPLEPFAVRRGISVHTARSWIQRNRIPAEHWKALADERIASLEELAEAAASEGLSRPVKGKKTTKWAEFPVLRKTSGGSRVTSELVYRLLDESE